jgi:outer membrane protein OmpA-like peptidoglycan-associated protein
MTMRNLVIITAVSLLTGCGSTGLKARETGALTGGAMGAGLGAIVGNATGNTGPGIAIGAAAGALAGGLVGNEVDKENAALDAMDQKLDRQDRMIEENRRIIRELKMRGADVRMTKRGVIVNLPDVLFEFDSARLKPDAIRASRDIADVLKQYPGRPVAVEGHTDAIGTIAYNQKLSEERARSVAEELAVNGISRRQMTIFGFGETAPIASNRTEPGRQRNRRVEVILENK